MCRLPGRHTDGGRRPLVPSLWIEGFLAKDSAKVCAWDSQIWTTSGNQYICTTTNKKTQRKKGWGRVGGVLKGTYHPGILPQMGSFLTLSTCACKCLGMDRLSLCHQSKTAQAGSEEASWQPKPLTPHSHALLILFSPFRVTASCGVAMCLCATQRPAASRSVITSSAARAMPASTTHVI